MNSTNEPLMLLRCNCTYPVSPTKSTASPNLSACPTSTAILRILYVHTTWLKSPGGSTVTSCSRGEVVGEVWSDSVKSSLGSTLRLRCFSITCWMTWHSSSFLTRPASSMYPKSTHNLTYNTILYIPTTGSYDHYWTIQPLLDHYWTIWPYDHYWTIWPSLDHMTITGPFDHYWTITGPYDHCWTIWSLLDHYWTIWPLLDHLTITGPYDHYWTIWPLLDHCWIIWPLLDHLTII